MASDVILETGKDLNIKSKPLSGFSKWWAKNRTGYLLMLPFLILFSIFICVPVGVSFGLSFTSYNMIQPPRWVGLTNYRNLILDDDIFLIALKNTLIFSCVTGPLGYVMSFLVAWVINELKFRKAFALAFYAPSITSGIAMSVVWLYFFSSDRYGFVNNLLINLGIILEPIMWNLNSKTIMPVIMIVSVWMSMGTGFLVTLAGLQNVPRELYEAGRIDGIHSRFQELWYITIPMITPQLLFTAINTIVGSFGVFDVAVSIAGMPSPNYAGHTIVAHLYDYAFIRFQMGYASAIAMVLFFLTFVLGRVSMKVFASRDT
ncbi:MAG: sugar ABC transporter permease [Clostridiaceae bacterium]|jgi:multiple sugar transport system permease protein|nr:sugar ABC transporter permease [Clostridiaceae bacterium]